MKIKHFGLLLVLGLFPIFIACNNDDDSGEINLTSDEIVSFLKGKWVVSGELRYSNAENGENFINHYKGTIEFDDNHKFAFSVIEGNKYGGSICLEKKIVDDYYGYSLLKKDKKSFIVFTNGSSNFEIVSLKKNSFRLVLNKDKFVDNKKVEHIYMTMDSN